MGNFLIEFGSFLETVGIKLLPFSFVAYLIISWVLYILKNRDRLKLVKSIWYISNAIMLMTKDTTVEMIAIMILFMESSDLIYDYLELKKNRKNKNFV